MAKKFNHIFWMINEEEIDLINVLLHIIEKHDDILSPPEVGIEFELNRCITTNMHDISASLGYTELDIQGILSSLDSLTKNVATIYYDFNDGIQMEKGAFLNKYTVTSSKNDINKRITLWINSDIITVLQEHKYLYNLFYKHAKYELKSRYAMLIYDFFLNKESNKFITNVEEFAALMDYDLTTTEWDWSRLNSNILKRGIKEINSKTDLQITYAKVKTGAGGRIQTTQIEFEYYQAKDEMDGEIFEYFTHTLLNARKVDYYIEKEIKDRYTTLQRFKDKSAIANPEAYMAKMRRDALKERDEFEAKILVQEWSNVIKYEHTAEDGFVGMINYMDNDTMHDFVTINNDYRIYDPFNSQELSTSARDTLQKINEYFAGGEDTAYTIHPMPNVKNCSISYSKG